MSKRSKLIARHAERQERRNAKINNAAWVYFLVDSNRKAVHCAKLVQSPSFGHSAVRSVSWK